MGGKEGEPEVKLERSVFLELGIYVYNWSMQAEMGRSSKQRFIFIFILILISLPNLKVMFRRGFLIFLRIVRRRPLNSTSSYQQAKVIDIYAHKLKNHCLQRSRANKMIFSNHYSKLLHTFYPLYLFLKFWVCKLVHENIIIRQGSNDRLSQLPIAWEMLLRLFLYSNRRFSSSCWQRDHAYGTILLSGFMDPAAFTSQLPSIDLLDIQR